ncbi:MAG TPA: isochorismatase family protein [Steroidobacteraceae bacterium]|nr:isochorismatase family protein [Steroidobacteraceae bacterium]
MTTATNMRVDDEVFVRQGFGRTLGLVGRLGLVIVDFVAGFADPTQFGGGNIPEAIERTVELLSLARASSWPVAHTRIVFSEASLLSDVFCRKVPSLRELTETAEAGQLVPQLQPAANELVVRKAAPSAFFETGLRSWLTQKQVETLLVAGSTTSGCVRATVVDAMSSGFRPVVIKDCVGDRAAAPHAASLFDMQQKYADVITFSELLQGVDASAVKPNSSCEGVHT